MYLHVIIISQSLAILYKLEVQQNQLCQPYTVGMADLQQHAPGQYAYQTATPCRIFNHPVKISMGKAYLKHTKPPQTSAVQS